jgi:hypothetical protein
MSYRISYIPYHVASYHVISYIVPYIISYHKTNSAHNFTYQKSARLQHNDKLTDHNKERHHYLLPFTTNPTKAKQLLYTLQLSCNKKVQCTLVQALRLCTGRTAHRESRSIALLFLDHGTRRGEGSASRPGRSLPPGKTRYPLYRRLGGPQGRSGQVRKISPPTGI